MTIKKSKIKLLDENTKKGFTVDGYVIDLDLYKVWVDVVFGQDKQMQRFKKIRAAGYVHMDTDEYNTHLIWIKDKNNLDTMVHEVYHLVNVICKSRGLSEDDTNEQQAYLMGWLFSKIRRLK